MWKDCRRKAKTLGEVACGNHGGPIWRELEPSDMVLWPDTLPKKLASFILLIFHDSLIG